MKKEGFTLIELLIVIAIIAVIISFAVPNFLGARQRANDTKKKAELVQLKNALRLYYNDYNKYPGGTSGMVIVGCGTLGSTDCPCSTSIDFAAGGTDGCGTIYMKKLPIIGTAVSYRYYQAVDGDNFCLKATLENASDPEILASWKRCGDKITYSGPCNGGTPNVTGNDFVVCAD